MYSLTRFMRMVVVRVEQDRHEPCISSATNVVHIRVTYIRDAIVGKALPVHETQRVSKDSWMWFGNTDHVRVGDNLNWYPSTNPHLTDALISKRRLNLSTGIRQFQ